MVILCPLTFLCFIALSCVSVIAERGLLCSSEQLSIWYTFNGPLYYLSATASPCSLGVNLFSITYTLIPMFTIDCIGYHVSIHYKGQLWLEHIEPDVPCEDLKICSIIKGETLHETFPVYMKKFNGPEGVYQIYLSVNIVDDLGNKVTLQFNVTLEAKNDANERKFSVPQLGGLG